MSRLSLFVLSKKLSAISLNRGIRTDAVLLVRKRGNVPPLVPYEPGIRHRKEEFEDVEDIESQENLNQDIDIMGMDRVYDMYESEKHKQKWKLQNIITAKKFFSSTPDPLTLTCNERQCIRFLHKKDPVQWNLKTLSESFPATSQTIKKIINQKWKITPERAKIMDSRVQKNWELLAEGKLKADPKLLEHLKKFINRREILLEQLKNAQFYLPEVKKEPVWNQGEFNSILNRYEKRVKKLVEKKPKMIKDGVSLDVGEGKEKKSSQDIVYKKIDKEVSIKRLENKDSFLFGNVTKFYSTPVTEEDLEEELLRRADAGEKLSVFDKAIVEAKLSESSQNNMEGSSLKNTAVADTDATEGHYVKINLENKLVMGKTNKKRMREKERSRSFQVSESPGENLTNEKRLPEMYQKDTKMTGRYLDNIYVEDDFPELGNTNVSKKRMREEELMGMSTEIQPPDDETKFTTETGLGKLLNSIQSPPKPEDAQQTETKSVKKKNNKKFLKNNNQYFDKEKWEKEGQFFDRQIKDISDTAFWNSKTSNTGNAEVSKTENDTSKSVSSDISRCGNTYVTQDHYPERIKIPKNKYIRGVTYRVKDCYYDDDGEFLYRVPGMTK